MLFRIKVPMLLGCFLFFWTFGFRVIFSEGSTFGFPVLGLLFVILDSVLFDVAVSVDFGLCVVDVWGWWCYDVVCTRLLCLVFVGFEFGALSLFCGIYYSVTFLWACLLYVGCLILCLVVYARDL